MDSSLLRMLFDESFCNVKTSLHLLSAIEPAFAFADAYSERLDICAYFDHFADEDFGPVLISLFTQHSARLN